MQYMKTLGQRILKLLDGQAFLVKAPVTLTFDLKINRGHLILMTNLLAKYEGFLRYWVEKLF